MKAGRIGRATCGELDSASRREWLVTNGRGGYAMGTLAGMLTRRYHGLLVAALAPPVDRRLVVAACELDVTYDAARYALATNAWASGAIAPQGYRLIESFALVSGLPTWTYACGDALLEVTIAMPDGLDATALGLRVVRARGPLDVCARVLFADRDHHGGPLPDPRAFVVALREGGAEIDLPWSQRRVLVHAPGANASIAAERYADFALAREAERGLTATDDYAHLLTLETRLAPGAAGGFVFSLDPAASGDAQAIIAQRRARDGVLEPLARAAHAFIVRRGDGGRTVIAGYPWFADWGRDTMISLPGLTLATGRAPVAAEILRTFAAFVDGGMLPNRFPDDGLPAEYNTVDAALWFIDAVRAYVGATGDEVLLRELFPVLEEIVTSYRDGTRYGIGTDNDGLVHAGVPGMQLTWMDAKLGDRVVTPRIGKPVEINALWYAGLRAMEGFAKRLGEPLDPYRALADRVAVSFDRFWNPAREYCFDVVDGPGGDDPAVRPNALFAVGLHVSPLAYVRAKAVVDGASRALLTSHGLRTLAPDDPDYHGHYGGDQPSRDAAYHQGTVWPWLIGPFVRAHLRVYRDPERARSFLRPLFDELNGYAIGTLAEIFEGDPPHAPRGCIAQAWSVAQLIEARDAVERFGSNAEPTTFSKMCQG
ncbi:MAG: amylo-alpha-1,6-glucosidase [Candidatus Velthaea sp.]